MFNYLSQGGYVFSTISWLVSSLYYSGLWKTTQSIFTKFDGNVAYGPRKKPLDLGVDPVRLVMLGTVRVTVWGVPTYCACQDSLPQRLSNSTGCPLFFKIDFPWLFHDQKMKIHDLSAQHIFPSKRYTTYEYIPELVVTVPSARSIIVQKIKRFIIWLYKWSRVTFTELLSAVVKIPWHYHHFPWLFHDLCYFPWLSRPGKWSS